jgi:hypothetical protein
MSQPPEEHPMEPQCRRWLALYPAAHRHVHEEEMIGVLLDNAREGQRRLDPRDALDLIFGAARIRLRRSGPMRHPDWADALAVLSVLAPVLLCVEDFMNSSLGPLALVNLGVAPRPVTNIWLPVAHRYWNVSRNWDSALLLHAYSAWPLVLGGPVVLALALLRLRRTAGMAALATAILGGLYIQGAPEYERTFSSPELVITVCTAALAAAALLLSPGPTRGLHLLRRQPALDLTGAAALAFILLALNDCVEWYGAMGFRMQTVDPLPVLYGRAPVMAAILGAIGWWCLRTPVRRRVLVLLAVPGIPYIDSQLWLYQVMHWVPSILEPTHSILLLLLFPALLAALIWPVGQLRRLWPRISQPRSRPHRPA